MGVEGFPVQWVTDGSLAVGYHSNSEHKRRKKLSWPSDRDGRTVGYVSSCSVILNI